MLKAGFAMPSVAALSSVPIWGGGIEKGRQQGQKSTETVTSRKCLLIIPLLKDSNVISDERHQNRIRLKLTLYFKKGGIND